MRSYFSGGIVFSDSYGQGIAAAVGRGLVLTGQRDFITGVGTNEHLIGYEGGGLPGAIQGEIKEVKGAAEPAKTDTEALVRQNIGGVAAVGAATGKASSGILRLPAAQSLSATEKNKARFKDMLGDSISKPLLGQGIPLEEINQILVYAAHKKILEAKLGETVIDIWPFVPALLKKFPKAKIYVVCEYPEIFQSAYFKGRVVPITPQQYLSQKAFLKDNPVDLIFDLSMNHKVGYSYMEPENFYNDRRPYIFEISPPASLFNASQPQILGFQDVAIYYRNRDGRRFLVSGVSEALEASFTDGKVKEKGIWSFAQSLCIVLGLDSSLDYIRPTGDERAYAVSILKGWYDLNNPSEPFDPNKKIFIVNLDAVTHSYMISEDLWKDIIHKLLKLDAYIIFTSGSPRESSDLAEHLIGQVSGMENRNRIILPKSKLFPVINDILGITSWVLTIDTGLSHLANGVYNIPTTILTKEEILHWLAPWKNVHPVIVDNPANDPEVKGLLEALAKMEKFLSLDNIKEEYKMVGKNKIQALSAIIKEKKDNAIVSDVLDQAENAVNSKQANLDSQAFASPLFYPEAQTGQSKVDKGPRGDTHQEDKGGIDLRSLPIVTQSMTLASSSGITPGTINASNVNLDQEWQQIKNMLHAGIIPSIDRIREYLVLSCKSEDCQARIDKALSCIADILRIEEERCFVTEAALKQLLVLLESDKPANELQLAFTKIEVLAKEPVSIGQ